MHILFCYGICAISISRCISLPSSHTASITSLAPDRPAFDDFERHYEQQFAGTYGYLRRVIPDVVNRYHACGDLRQGFARIRCPECHHEYLLSFSCRGRWFCP
ncbi:MAG: transposase zinc-binding domain-containing protein, partial [Deltaproteobacteria bacterium]|nr:transposase zinc-binding domain-containing protein [Candidatus Anaeroferrophillacea bacterium]